jgi:hypothetical protein
VINSDVGCQSRTIEGIVHPVAFIEGSNLVGEQQVNDEGKT